MGAGIAQVTAAAGKKVVLVDKNADILEKSRNAITKSITKIASKKFAAEPEQGEKWVADVIGSIRVETDGNAAASNASLVIEAIVENMDIKKSVWAELDKHAPAEALFASNTSSLSIGEMAKATQRPAQFGGLHFFSPVPMMKLVEVVQAETTSDETFDALFAFSKEIKKVPIKCKDTKGFVVNRLLVPFLMEAVRMVERGDATIEDIDTAMKLGAGHPMGPLQLSDAVGLDVTNAIIQGWHKEEPEEPLFKPSPLLEKLVAEGRLGMKVGKGFYPTQ
eukprot:TRINITY_DN65775_c0_g1_i1.p2 TRINITY_DN65775_c0_g1~~TRINITY_DN65775_c0_g1_i1.p2  ORF type:complete len:314 (+),score=151.35 TRINITY_DN65775_c0_g1_i1:109-942(+)